jgi:glycosyltransferase involved in cell wall biosynthesis
LSTSGTSFGMPVYLDISPAVHAKAGLSRYADSLAQALLEQRSGDLAFFFNRSGDCRIPSWVADYPTRTVRAGYKPWRMLVWLGHLTKLGFDRLLPGCRLLHATEHLLIPVKCAPSIMTVHDLIFHLYPQHHKPLNRWFLNTAMPLFCRRASAIICVSKHTREDLIQSWNIAPQKIHVVYEGVDPRFRPAAPAQIAEVRGRYGLPDEFMLTVGTIEPRKNLIRLLDALALMREQGEDVRLVVAGRLGWMYGDFLSGLERFAHRDAVTLLGFVPDADLPALYSAARLTVVPSVYEGFGLPLLESMACGTPVVSSRSASLPELGGDSARYFDPLNVDAMTCAVIHVWHQLELRDELRASGLARAAEFTWTKAAGETIRVYDRVIKNW